MSDEFKKQLAEDEARELKRKKNEEPGPMSQLAANAGGGTEAEVGFARAWDELQAAMAQLRSTLFPELPEVKEGEEAVEREAPPINAIESRDKFVQAAAAMLRAQGALAVLFREKNDLVVRLADLCQVANMEIKKLRNGGGKTASLGAAAGAAQGLRVRE